MSAYNNGKAKRTTYYIICTGISMNEKLTDLHFMKFIILVPAHVCVLRLSRILAIKIGPLLFKRQWLALL